ncbi:MAG TPA: isoprenylcysteine carboxylmethyltransferase family protein [Candidatus Acidoferrales bacterium]|nr:isoprenylcysteine carboxylmethyltransferase family protein [Candidatus Acidoferrales bacterium]
MRTLFDAVRALLYATGFILFFGWIALRLRAYDHSLHLALPSAVLPFGAVLMCSGAVLAILCIATFVVRGRGTPALFDPPRQFVATGPYRCVRNPMYIGGFCLLLGLGLYLRSPAIVLMVAAIILACHLLVVFYEEPVLRRKFGAPYQAYCAAVGRWLPRLPRASARMNPRPNA